MAVKVEIREASFMDAELMAPLIRKADIDELAASSGVSVERALMVGVEVSRKCWVGLVDDEYVAIFGVSDEGFMSRNGVAWLVGTDLIQKHARVFMRESKSHMAEMRAGYDMLYNYVDCRNKKAIKWLEWLGFSMKKPAPHGILGLPFMRFEMRT